MYEESATLNLTEEAHGEALASRLGGSLTQDAGPVRNRVLEQFYLPCLGVCLAGAP